MCPHRGHRSRAIWNTGGEGNLDVDWGSTQRLQARDHRGTVCHRSPNIFIIAQAAPDAAPASAQPTPVLVSHANAPQAPRALILWPWPSHWIFFKRSGASRVSLRSQGLSGSRDRVNLAWSPYCSIRAASLRCSITAAERPKKLVPEPPSKIEPRRKSKRDRAKRMVTHLGEKESSGHFIS